MGKMRRNTTGRAATLAGALLLGACAKAELSDVPYAHNQCKRAELVDMATGLSLRGAEDLAFDPDTGRLFISAYDRRAAEAAAKRNATVVPYGGVFAVDVDMLFDLQAEPLKLASLVASSDIAGGLRPHGLEFDKAAGELVFINRTYERRGRKWKLSPKIQRIGVNGEMVIGESVSAHCAANDIAVVVDGARVTTVDHRNCDWRAGFEDVFSLKRSGLVNEGGAYLFDSLGFANGVTSHGKGVAVAATRENAVVALQPSGDHFAEVARFATPGAPDNLSSAEGGALIAAVHPSLWRLAFNRKLGLGKAPSRVVKIDAARGEVHVLFDDPSGAVFSAATIAVETARGLVIGSVTDRGLLVCENNSE